MGSDVGVAEDGAGCLRFPEDEFVQPRQRRFEAFPDPKHDLFGRRVFHEVVEILMIESVDDSFADDSFDTVEIFDHATRRSTRAQRSLNRDLQTIRMTVQPRALPRMERQRVRGFKAERFPNKDLQFSLRPHCFQMPFE